MNDLKKKKLLVLVSAFSKNKDDSGDFTLDLSSRLNKKFQVTVLAPHDKGLKWREKIKGLEVRRFVYFFPYSLQQLAYRGGIPYNLKTSFWAKIQVPFFFFSELVAAIRIIKREKIDIIQSHWLLPQGLVGAICQKYYHVNHVATIHSSEITLLKKIPFGRKITEFIFKNSEQLVSVSHHRFKEISSFISPKVSDISRKKVSFIPMGINLKAFKFKTDQGIKRKLGIKGDSPVVLFIGRLVEVKGCEYLIKAFKFFLKKASDARLIIVGSGFLAGELIELTQKLGINRRVNFIGFVDHKEIYNYYQLADMVVFPSIVDPSGYQEGIPVVLLEAMACGKLVIATDIKGVTEIISDGSNGYLTKPKDYKGMAEKMISIIDSDQTKVRSEALKDAQKFDWERIAQEYIRVLEK